MRSHPDHTALLWGLGLTLGSLAVASLFGRRAKTPALPAGSGTTSSSFQGSGPPVVISTYAGNIDWWPGTKPALIEWPGYFSKPGAHPSWESVAEPLRDGSGQLLPNLLRKYGQPSPRRIAVIGFSAGSNSGLGQLLKHPADRAMVDFVGSFDGIHVYTGTTPPPPADPLAYFKYREQISPWYDVMLAGARGEKGVVVTASDVAPPAVEFTKTRTALNALLQSVGIATGRLTAGDTPWTSPPMKYRAGDLQLPPSLLATLQGSWGTTGEAVMGQLVGLMAPNGNQASDHIKQAKMIGPILNATLVPRWRAGGYV